MQMDIKGGSFDTSKKKSGVFVKCIESDGTVQVISSERSVQDNTVPYQSVVSYHDRPEAATENKTHGCGSKFASHRGICPSVAMLSSLLNALQAFNRQKVEDDSDSSTATRDTISELDGRMSLLHLDAPSPPRAQITATAPNAFSVSGVTAQLASLHLEELSTPSHAQGITPAPENQASIPSFSSTDSDALEALITASVLSATPIDTLHHNKLFSSSTQFYKDHSMAIPSIKSLDPSAALDGLHALTNRVLPAFWPGRIFGCRTTPNSARQTRSPSPSLLPTKIQEREACTLQQLEQQFDSYHRQIFDGDFTAQSEAVQQTLLDEVNTWLEKGMITLRTLEEREQEWRKKQASEKLFWARRI
ncbi:hypothetical protein BT96DRAFT_988487 [Gymnopus androsaceus JB14]|uniref:Uncharacterized protein n=1 Tax=Gymnopus androsaceus JB14 TaxID=1447944 RepID=A0A6A4I6A7_9AGAR|nr:hypothetical protein BT96DRAFT_988487 [Gymnopus androsaceus JB14]